MMLLMAALSAVMGMGWFALIEQGNWARVWGDASIEPLPSAVLRGAGTLALCVSLALCVGADPAPIAVLVWVMALAAAAWSIALILTYRARWLRVLVWKGTR